MDAIAHKSLAQEHEVQLETQVETLTTSILWIGRISVGVSGDSTSYLQYLPSIASLPGLV